MLWSTEPGAGFSAATPWLPLSADHTQRNVEVQRAEPDSMLELYRALLALRRARPSLSLGSYAELDTGETVLGYARELGGVRDVVLLNIGSERQPITLPGLASARVLISTHLNRNGSVFDGALGPDEALVLDTSPERSGP